MSVTIRCTIAFCVLGTLQVGVNADELLLEPDSVSKDYGHELPRSQPTSPGDSLERFQLVPGFAIDLVASEPLLADPVSMAFDEHGRIFVVCMQGYSEHRHDELGNVRLLQDTNGDGRFDQATTYVSGLTWPAAVACFDGGIFVAAAPDVWYCKDIDGDGKADIQERVLTGFGHQNVQGMLNSFRWGLDNRLYGATGTNGGQVSADNSADSLNLRGRDFSWEPHARKLRAASGGAQHGATFDRWGNRFVCSNSDHLQWIEYEDHHLRRNPYIQSRRRYPSRRSIAVDGPAAAVYRTSPIEPWRLVRTRLRVKGMVRGPVEGGGRAAGYFTSASGITAYTGDAFPAPFTGELEDGEEGGAAEGRAGEGEYVFVGDVGSNLIHLKKIETTGLSKRAVRATDDQVEFLTSSDNWFRPVQFANGPDGCLYVIDMYRETIEHPLSLPPMIKKHLDLNSGRDRGRIYRIRPKNWTQPQRPWPGEATSDQLVRMLGHENGWHRETAARLLTTRGVQDQAIRTKLIPALQSQLSQSNVHARIRSLYCLATLDAIDSAQFFSGLEDHHPQVRIHTLKILEAKPNSDAEVLARMKLLTKDEDPRVRYQLALSLGSLDWSERGPILSLLADDFPVSKKMQFAILSSMGEHHEKLLEAMLQQISSKNTEALSAEIAYQIGRRNKSFKEAYAIILEHASDRDRERAMLAALYLGTGLRGEKLVHRLATIDDVCIQTLEDIVDDARSHLADETQPAEQRMLWLDRLMLGSFQVVESSVRDLLQAKQPASIRNATVEALAKTTSVQAADMLIGQLPTLPPVGRRQAYELLVARDTWANRLLQSVRDDRLSPDQISSRYADLLRRHRDSSIAQAAQELLGPPRDRKDVVQQMQGVLKQQGDPQRGKQAFAKVCSTCHRLDSTGSAVGPDLQPLRNRGAQYLLTHIVDPNREIDSRYEAYSVVTHDGTVHSGLLIQDTRARLELLQADGKVMSLAKTDVDSVQATGRSLMPEGLEQELSPQGVADVIAYLIQNAHFE